MSTRSEMERQLEAMIDDDARARRAQPLAFVCEVLEVLRDSDEDGFLAIWRTRARSYRWYATDALACLDLVLAAPPVDLVEQLHAGTGFSLVRADASGTRPYTRDEVLSWLRELTAKMRAIYDASAAG